MALIRANTSGGGGGGSVATGTFSVTSQAVSQQITVDTGLGASIKKFVVIGISNFYPQPNGGYATALSWCVDTPNDYDGGCYGQAGFHTTITGARYGAMALGIVSYDNAGKFVLDTTPNAGTYYSTGDYTWYAE